ncbi:MAG TPA: hypothetical protein VFX61_19360 [Micromonosporaceae bacterium]|nr:hypothetical protein [Micromonosporaceae bacterium]
MKEDEFRDALRGAMTVTDAPPPMSTERVLRAGQRARFRRRTAWLSSGSAAAVLAVVGAVTFAGMPSGPVGLSPAGPAPQTLPQPAATGTVEPMPTGPDGKPQEDRTARAGDRADQAAALLSKIISVVPAGYTTPENPASPMPNEPPFRDHQASFEERVNGIEVWGYYASVAVVQEQQMGTVLVEVHTAGNQLPNEPCALAQQFWGMRGECQVVTVGATQVGVVVEPHDDRRFDQWAAYRHPDGVVVFVAQSATPTNKLPSGVAAQPLAALPFTVQQLADLAVDERFHLQ